MNPITLVVGILQDALDVQVLTEMPEDRPGSCVMVSLEGDSSTEVLLRPTIALTCWAASDKAAHELALSAMQALQEEALDHPYLSSIGLESLSREQWSRNGQSRYLAILDMTINVD